MRVICSIHYDIKAFSRNEAADYFKYATHNFDESIGLEKEGVQLFPELAWFNGVGFKTGPLISRKKKNLRVLSISYKTVSHDHQAGTWPNMSKKWSKISNA